MGEIEQRSLLLGNVRLERAGDARHLLAPARIRRRVRWWRGQLLDQEFELLVFGECQLGSAAAARRAGDRRIQHLALEEMVKFEMRLERFELGGVARMRGQPPYPGQHPRMI